MKLTKKNIIIIFLIFIIIIGMLLIGYIIKKMNINNSNLPEIKGPLIDNTGNEIKPTSTQYNSLEEAVKNYKVEYKKQTVSDKDGFVVNLYVEFNKKLSKENKTYFYNFIKTTVSYTQYNSFRIIDEKNNINIDVYCSNNSVDKIIINGKENYFSQIENKTNLEKYSEYPVTEVTVESEELKQFIDNNWEFDVNTYGAKEGVYFNFKNSIDINVIDGKLFNIVFKRTYIKNVVSNLKPASSLEEVKNTLGEPTFKGLDGIPPYGYKTKDFYIFFSEEQISIYPILVNTNDKTLQNAISNLEKNNNDIDKFIKEVTSKWKNYDVYKEDDGKFEIQYTLKGIRIQNINAYEPSITIYGDFEGLIKNNKKLKDMVDIDLPDCIVLESTRNLIFETEKTRFDLCTMPVE